MLDRPGTDADELLPIFAIRAELEAVSDSATLREFGREVEDGVRAAAHSGSLTEVNDVLRNWLGIALAGQALGEHVRLSRAERGAHRDRLVGQWLQARGFTG